MSHDDLSRTFREVLEPLKYSIPQPAESVFAPAGPAEFQIGGAVTKLEGNLCFPFSGSATLSVGNVGLAKGSLYLEIAWEVYSTSERRVIFRRTTPGSFQTDDSVRGGAATIMLNAIGTSLSNLAAEAEFQKRLSVTPKQATPDT